MDDTAPAKSGLEGVLGNAGRKTVSGKKQNGRLLGETRRIRMLEWLREEGSARVSDLAQAFGVSEVTVRQDLEKLETDGHVISRTRWRLSEVDAANRFAAWRCNTRKTWKPSNGSAAPPPPWSAMAKRSSLTPVRRPPRLLPICSAGMDMTVITNALNIALMLGAEPGFDVHMTGGHFKAPTLSLSGERSADYFRGLYAQKLFLATGAIDIENGLTYPSLSDIAVKRAMIDSAQSIFLVADSSKIGERSFCVLGGLEQVDVLITDAGISDEHRKAIEAAGVEVIIAS